MSATVSYTRSGRLLISGIKCDCPCTHNTPMQDIYIGSGILKNLPAYIKKRELGQRLVLVADPNTYAVAGKRAQAYLTEAGFDVTLCYLDRGAEQLEADESAVGELVMTMDMGTDFFVSVGSGSITDITRTVASQTERPFVAIGTAPSMDGYTSVVAPMLLHGVKMHVKGVCPEVILCDLDVLRTATPEMYVAGVGDVLGKYIAKADWVLGHIVNGEEYCPTCGEIVIDAVNKLLDNIDEIKNRTEQGTRVLIEALLLAGMTIMIVGHTRAVASIEHNIGHYWEMQKLLAKEKCPKHGTAVGVSTLRIWPYYENFKTIDPATIDVEECVAKKISREERVKFMLDMYGERAATAIMEENPGDFLTDEELRRRVTTIKARFGDIVAELNKMPSYERIDACMQALGAPRTPEEIGISATLARRALLCGKDYRTRYSLFKTIDEIGRSTATERMPLR